MTRQPSSPLSAALRVVLAEDSYLVRDGTRRVLEAAPDVVVLAAVGTAAELLEAVERLAPDAALVDVRMPPGHGMEGIEAAHVLRRLDPGIGVVILSQHADESYVLELMRDGIGGLGYLLKERVGNRDELVRALRETAAGGSVIDPLLVEPLVRRRREDTRSPIGSLTPRELDVLRLMAEGRTNAAIGSELGLSESSIEKHTTVIFEKLGLAEERQVHRRVAAVVEFLRSQGR